MQDTLCCADALKSPVTATRTSEGVAQMLLVGHDTTWDIRVRELRGGTHCTQRSEDIRDTIGERLAGDVSRRASTANSRGGEDI